MSTDYHSQYWAWELTRRRAPDESEESVSTYLQRPESFALPKGQRQLLTLVLRKILASSSYAIAATLGTMLERLEAKESGLHDEVAPDAPLRLVDRFDQDRKVFLSPDFKEEQLRAESLNPFFESLGWDVANKAGLTEVFKPVIHSADGLLLTAYSPRLPDSDSGRSAASRWSLAIAIGSLYYPDCPHEFSVLPADILGQVYEQFLGKVIRLTAGHQAKVEEKPEVRKAGGVHNAPTYIVKNTVGRLVEGETPADASGPVQDEEPTKACLERSRRAAAATGPTAERVRRDTQPVTELLRRRPSWTDLGLTVFPNHPSCCSSSPSRRQLTHRHQHKEPRCSYIALAL